MRHHPQRAFTGAHAARSVIAEANRNAVARIVRHLHERKVPIRGITGDNRPTPQLKTRIDMPDFLNRSVLPTNRQLKKYGQSFV
jgi:hypothetical protein